MANRPSSAVSPQSARARRWQLLRDETAAVLRLAVPVVVVQLGMMLMGTVDTMMLGRVSAEALAAGSLGNGFTLGILVLPFGTLMALDPLVAQSYGAGNHRSIAHHFGRGLVLAALMTVPVCLLLRDTSPFLAYLGQQEVIIDGAAAYSRALIPGVAAFLLFVVLRQTLQAMSVVRPAVISIVVGNVVNVIANYAMIFGHLGFPALGVVGSAYASCVARWVMVLTLAVAAHPILRPYWRRFGREAFSLAGHRRLLYIGMPIGIHLSLEVWIFVAVALLMGSLGAQQLAGHQVAISLASLSFMVPLGIGAAAATRVGNAIGRQQLTAARRSAVVCLGLGCLVMLFFAVLFWSAPALLGRLYSNEPRVIQMSVLLIPIAALFQVFDGTQVVAAGVLRGSADTRLPAVLSFVGFWLLGLPLGYLLAFPFDQGPKGLWWGLTFGLAAVSFLLVARIRVHFSSPIPQANLS